MNKDAGMSPMGPHPQAVIAESTVMLEILDFVRRIAVSEAATSLLDRENGTGKDLTARTLHDQSRRQAEPFITVNCAAIPGTLLESELFGYEKGAFTDARARKRGIFELADRCHEAVSFPCLRETCGNCATSERILLARALEQTGGNQAQAAQL